MFFYSFCPSEHAYIMALLTTEQSIMYTEILYRNYHLVQPVSFPYNSHSVNSTRKTLAHGFGVMS